MINMKTTSVRELKSCSICELKVTDVIKHMNKVHCDGEHDNKSIEKCELCDYKTDSGKLFQHIQFVHEKF